MLLSDERLEWLMLNASKFCKTETTEVSTDYTTAVEVCTFIPSLIADLYTERQLKEDADRRIDEMREHYLTGLSVTARAKLGLPTAKLRSSVMNIKYKKLHPDAVAPRKGTVGAAGHDLTAVAIEDDFSHNVTVYHTGLALEIPQGYVGYIFPRSSIYKEGLRMSNCVGVVDSDFRGEILIMFDKRCGQHTRQAYKYYTRGERVAQLVVMPIPDIEFEEAVELSKTERGEKGYGSTGR